MSSPPSKTTTQPTNSSTPPLKLEASRSDVIKSIDDALDDKPRLSEHEKKANHIASEQKRRQAIRDGFDRLTDLVPGLEGQGRSESVVLKRTVDFMREQLAERDDLRKRLVELGGSAEEEASEGKT